MAVITEQQTAFLESFGFLRIEGLFAVEIEEITDVFDALIRSAAGPELIGKHPRLAQLPHDDRIYGIARSVLGADVECTEIGGDAAECCRGWHADTSDGYPAQRHIKISLVLHPLRANSGAVRVIPGTHLPQSSYAQELRHLLCEFGEPSKAFGVDSTAIPSTVIDADPGDVLVWHCHLIHASINGADRCRMYSIGFSDSPAPGGTER